MTCTLKYKIQRGFSLMELMIALSILAVVMAIAIPDFTSIIQNDSITTVTNDLIAGINYARSEAIKRGSPVSICATTDQNFNSCGSNWKLGWIVFPNPTGGTTLTTALRTGTITNSNITFAAGVNILTYNGSGFAKTGSGNVTFTIKATGCTIDSGRSIAISVTGRPSVSNISCP